MPHPTILHSLPVAIPLEDRSGNIATRTDTGLSQHTVGGTSRTPRTKVRAWEISSTSTFAPAPFNNGPPRSSSDLEDYLSEAYKPDRKHETRLFRIEQQHSRDHIDPDAGHVKALLDRLDAFPALRKVFAAFHRDTAESYLGMAAAHFSPVIKDDTILELCCLLKYVESNDRTTHAVHRWSVRQMAFYQCIDTDREFETALLVNPSIQLVQDLRAQYKKDLSPLRSSEHWTRLPLMLFETLTINWSEYVSALHRAVEVEAYNVSFTDPGHSRSQDADLASMQNCAELMFALQVADHVLRNNISILGSALRIANKREAVAAKRSDRDLALFESGIDDIVTELQFRHNQIALTVAKLDKVSTNINNLIQLRGSFNMERTAVRSIVEARAVRFIALVTLSFVPPTFMAGLLQMGGLDIVIHSGHLIVDANPTFLFFLAVTIPLMIVVLSSWFVYHWYCGESERRRPMKDLKMV